MLAAEMVERQYCPHDSEGAFRMLASLNLLNAAVKMPWGRLLVSYSFIKGYAGCLLASQAYCPIEGLSSYYCAADDIVYFRVKGFQISFHHVPIYDEFKRIMPFVNGPVQQWDGIRLQQQAVELFLRACPECATTEAHPSSSLLLQMRNFVRPPIRTTTSGNGPPGRHLAALPVSLANLRHLITFNIWTSPQFTLFTDKHSWPLRVMRYNGRNYTELMNFLTENRPRLRWREPSTMESGKLYHVSPQQRIHTISPSRYILTMSHNRFLAVANNKCYDLCINYELARWLAMRLPKLHFVNLLNYNRLLNHRRLYTAHALKLVPLHSVARRLRVWLVIDRDGLLATSDLTDIPRQLLEHNDQQDEEYHDFQIVGKRGAYGLRAYHRMNLLPPVYKHIELHNNYAHVMRDDGKIAIYALYEECFKSDFIYKRISYNPRRNAIIGETDDGETVIFQFAPQRPYIRWFKRH